MLVLFETSAGYALFQISNHNRLQEVQDTRMIFSEENPYVISVQLSPFKEFSSIKESALASKTLIEDLSPQVPEELPENNPVSKDFQSTLMTTGNKLEDLTKSKSDADQIPNKILGGLLEKINFQLDESINGRKEGSMGSMLAHGLSRYKLKFSVDKIDAMIIQAVSLIEDLDREIKIYAGRLKDWFGWHFPELSKIVTDNILYAKSVKAIGNRNNFESFELSEFFSEDVEAEVKEAAQLSLGSDITETDEKFITTLAEQVIELSDNRTSLYEYLKTRMKAIAPNLSLLVGELIGARLIAHAGSLISLAKYPSSTIQVLGAEKSLVKALKTNQNTPKYGLIYQAGLIGQSSVNTKAKLARTLAAKCSVCVRVDALGESENGSVGNECRTYLESRSSYLESNVSKYDKGNKYKKHKSKERHKNNYKQPNKHINVSIGLGSKSSLTNKRHLTYNHREHEPADRHFIRKKRKQTDEYC